MTQQQMIFAIAVMAIVTAALRVLPFILFDGKKTPKPVAYLGQYLPYAVMGMLVVYCLKDTHFYSASGYLPAFIAAIATGVSFIWKRNPLLSILAGTVSYMLLVQLVFV